MWPVEFTTALEFKISSQRIFLMFFVVSYPRFVIRSFLLFFLIHFFLFDFLFYSVFCFSFTTRTYLSAIPGYFSPTGFASRRR